MPLPMTRTAAALGLLFAAVICAGNASAQQYPSRPIRMVLGFPPGGPVDDQSRLIAQAGQESLGQVMILDHKPGADGILAADTVAKAAPDGYTVLMASSGFTTTPALHAKLPYDPIKGFSPVIQTTTSTSTLVVHSSVLARNLSELIALAKSQPGKINYGSVGIGSLPHLSSELFAGMAGIKLTHIPYKGAAPAMTDLLGGQIQMIIGPMSASIAHIRSGKVRALAVTNPQRNVLIPDVPTIGESLPGFAVTSWYGMIAPGGTPSAVVSLLNREVGRILFLPAVKEKLVVIGLEPVGGSTLAFSGFVASEIQKWTKVARDAGIKPE